MTTVFFYGLFMDADLLQQRGFHPENIKRAIVRDYKLVIGERATLKPEQGTRSYGTVMDMDDDELKALYRSDGVQDYLPQEVIAYTFDDKTVETVSYILPMNQVSGSNSRYANQLAGVARKLDLPELYVREIEGWI